MDIRKLQRAIVDGLEDVKAQDIVVFNTEALSPLFERVIVASGTSNRQTKALAASVRDSVKAAGQQVLRTEGEDNGEWIIVDCGAAVAHIMQPAIRDYYRLEEIWGGKPVRMKLGAGGPVGLPKASEPDDEAPLPAKKAAAGKPATKQPAAKRPAVKRPAAKQAVARKAAAKKATARPVADKAPAKTGAAAKRPSARRQPTPAPRATQTVVAGAASAARKAAPRKAAATRQPTPGAARKPR
jgi:ribosome-associated protein